MSAGPPSRDAASADPADEQAAGTPDARAGGAAGSHGPHPPRATRGRLALAFALGFGLVLPFLDKAVHQDDWAYLRVSKLLLEHGADVFDQTTLYQGLEISAGQGVLHGPVWLLCLALAQQFGSASITVAHLFAAGFLGLLSSAVASLAARLGAPPLRSALTFVAAPAPWVLGTSLMTDLPMLALFATAVALAVRGRQEGHLPSSVAAGVFGALAALTRYHGFAIVPLLAVLPLAFGGRWRYGLVPAGVAGGLFLGFLALTLTATGQWDMLRATEELSRAVIDREACLLSTVAAFGGVTLGWPLAALTAPGAALSALRRDPALVALAALGAAGGAAAALHAPSVVPAPLEGVNLVLAWACFLWGGALLGALLRGFVGLPGAVVSAERRARWRAGRGPLAWIALWSLGFAVAAWWTVPFGSTRYVLPALPGAFLLLAAGWARALPARASWAALGLTAALGLGATVADHHAAAIYPELAREVRERERPGGPWAQGTTWIWGELGFRWYLEETAALAVLPTASDAPAPGDRVLKSMILSTASPRDGSTGRYRLHPDVVRRIRPGEIVAFDDPWPIRIHNSYAGAGFYGHEAGFLPWSFSSAVHDKLQVWNVEGTNPFFDHLDAAQVETSALEAAGPERPAVAGRVSLERFQVFALDDAAPTAVPDSGPVDDRMAVVVLLPGRVTWPAVPIPADRRLEVWVGEHHSLAQYGLAGPGSVVRLRVDGEVVAERTIDTRRGDAQVWYRLSADLRPWAGRAVDLAFEVVPALDGPAGDERPLLMVGFSDPRLAPVTGR